MKGICNLTPMLDFDDDENERSVKWYLSAVICFVMAAVILVYQWKTGALDSILEEVFR